MGYSLSGWSAAALFYMSQGSTTYENHELKSHRMNSPYTSDGEIMCKQQLMKTDKRHNCFKSHFALGCHSDGITCALLYLDANLMAFQGICSSLWNTNLVAQYDINKRLCAIRVAQFTMHALLPLY